MFREIGASDFALVVLGEIGVVVRSLAAGIDGADLRVSPFFKVGIGNRLA
jgi:hypothetical protein